MSPVWVLPGADCWSKDSQDILFMLCLCLGLQWGKGVFREGEESTGGAQATAQDGCTRLGLPQALHLLSPRPSLQTLQGHLFVPAEKEVWVPSVLV